MDEEVVGWGTQMRAVKLINSANYYPIRGGL